MTDKNVNMVTELNTKNVNVFNKIEDQRYTHNKIKAGSVLWAADINSFSVMSSRVGVS